MMKKQTIIAFTALTFLLNACTDNYTSTDYLNKVVNNLEEIESASYSLTTENWFPGDTVAMNIYHFNVKEYDNPSDTTIGSKFVKLKHSDTSVLEFCYDGVMRTLVYHDEKTLVLDSFKVSRHPFRILTPPFFNFAKSILKYTLETKDSISLDIKDLNKSVYLKLTIYEENQVEFFGKAFYMPISPYTYGENTSIYEFWIDKTNNLPYKIRREMYHNISVRICENVELNKMDIKDFNASDYFPDNYRIEAYRSGRKRKNKNELIGKEAPDWTLQTGDKLPISLADLKSKALMIQFTSVCCGPCVASIPFLKELSTYYKKEDFEFVAIESTSRNTNVLKSYQNRHDFDYKFLLSTKEVLESYSIRSFPVFFILDENRIIRNVIYGYGKGSTENEIRDALDELI